MFCNLHIFNSRSKSPVIVTEKSILSMSTCPIVPNFLRLPYKPAESIIQTVIGFPNFKLSIRLAFLFFSTSNIDLSLAYNKSSGSLSSLVIPIGWSLLFSEASDNKKMIAKFIVVCVLNLEYTRKAEVKKEDTTGEK